MRAMVAHVVSTVVASTVRSLVGVSTVVSLSTVNIPVGNLVAVSTVGNLSAVNVRAESLVAANIAVGNLVAVNTANVVAMVSIATERERQRYALPTSSPASVPESCLAGLRASTDFKHSVHARPADAKRLGDAVAPMPCAFIGSNNDPR